MQKILVTGGNTGIGLALCTQLAIEHKCHVYLGSRNLAKGEAAVATIKALSESAVVEAVQVDISDEKSVAEAAVDIKARLGDEKLYALVNNAGTGLQHVGVTPASILATNLYGTKRMCDAFLPLVAGRVVNVSSGAGPMFMQGTAAMFKDKGATEEEKKVLTDFNVTWEAIDHVVQARPADIDPLSAYGLSKAALTAYGVAMAREHPDLVIASLTPGFIKTAISAGHGATKTPEEGTVSIRRCLFDTLPGSGFFYGSDGLRSPLDRGRNPGDPEYTGEHAALFGYYVNPSNTPMKDQVLQSPFDNPTCHANNIASGALREELCCVHDGRLDPTLCPPGPHQIDPELFEKRGFLMLPHVSNTNNFLDEQERLTTYAMEMRELAQQITGCESTAIAAHVLRRQGSKSGARLCESTAGMRDAAFIIHNDFADSLKEQLLADAAEGVQNVCSQPANSAEPANGGLGLTQDELKGGRLVILNFWRPLAVDPITRNPLAVLDATSMASSEMVRCVHQAKTTGAKKSFANFTQKLPSTHINTLLRPSEAHKWYYFPGMNRDEVIAFKTYDSSACAPANGVAAHSSFDHPDTSATAPTRESIEMRVACFWRGA